MTYIDKLNERHGADYTVRIKLNEVIDTVNVLETAPGGGGEGGGAALDESTYGKWNTTTAYPEGSSVYYQDVQWVTLGDVPANTPPGLGSATVDQVVMPYGTWEGDVTSLGAAGGAAKSHVAVEITPTKYFDVHSIVNVSLNGQPDQFDITYSIYEDGVELTSCKQGYATYNPSPFVPPVTLREGHTYLLMFHLMDFTGTNSETGKLALKTQVPNAGAAHIGPMKVSYRNGPTDPSPITEPTYSPVFALRATVPSPWRKAYEPETLKTDVAALKPSMQTVLSRPSYSQMGQFALPGDRSKLYVCLFVAGSEGQVDWYEVTTGAAYTYPG